MSAKELRTSRERTLFAISFVFSALVWLVLVVSIVGVLYALLLGTFVLIAHCLLMAHITGNGVRIGPRQLPELMVRVESAARKLGLEKTPEAYVVQSGGILNAFATKILSRRFIILYSDLVEACDSDNPNGRLNELDFVIGHELGHLAAGHLAYRLFLLPAFVLPLIGAAYSRACEYTCDRCGHEVVGDLNVSSRALAILAAGPRTARKMDLDVFVEQRRETGRFWMAVYELNASHPFLSKRVAALREWRQQGSAQPQRRNVWSYPLAPFFGAMSGNPASAILVVIVIAAASASFAFSRRNQAASLLRDPKARLGGLYAPAREDPSDTAVEADVARLGKMLEESAKERP